MEFVFEFLFEIYAELMMLVVPEKKTTTKAYRLLVTLIAFLVLIGVLALAIWGLVLIVDKDNWWGIVPLVIAVLLSLAQIIAGFVLHSRKG